MHVAGHQIWKDNMLPLLAGHLAASMDSVTAYQLLYHETVVANLLEICMFHPHACQALPDDALLELCDWCYRKLVHLNTCKPAHPPLQGASLLTVPLDWLCRLV